MLYCLCITVQLLLSAFAMTASLCCRLSLMLTATCFSGFYGLPISMGWIGLRFFFFYFLWNYYRYSSIITCLLFFKYLTAISSMINSVIKIYFQSLRKLKLSPLFCSFISWSENCFLWVLGQRTLVLPCFVFIVNVDFTFW